VSWLAAARWSLMEENSEEDSPVLVLASRKECKYLIHETGRSSVAGEWYIQESVDLLPFRLAIAGGQACFQLLISIRSVWLHRIHQVSNRNHDVCGQLHQHMVIFRETLLRETMSRDLQAKTRGVSRRRH
jgi:hypothetical protein